MKNYIENKITKNQISFCLTNKENIEEREIHSYHEILLYLEGDVELFTLEGRRTLKNPSLLIIPAGTYHFFKPKNHPDFTRLKISFSVNVSENEILPEIMSELRIIENFNEEIKYICNKLVNVLRMNGKNAEFHAYSAFLMLISELDMCDVGGEKGNTANKKGPMYLIAEYIAGNLSESLDINSLAEIVHISPSGITHKFKKEFGIPIHKYIMQKRLIYAKRRAEEGEALTKLYSEVGFKDYSSFYKAYVNHFGNAPSKDKGDLS